MISWKSRLTVNFTAVMLVAWGMHASAAGVESYVAKLNDKVKTVEGKKYYLVIIKAPIIVANASYSELYINGRTMRDDYKLPSKDEILPGTLQGLGGYSTLHYEWLSPEDSEKIEVYGVLFFQAANLDQKQKETLREQAKKQAFKAKIDDLLTITVERNEEIPAAMEQSLAKYKELEMQKRKEDQKSK